MGFLPIALPLLAAIAAAQLPKPNSQCDLQKDRLLIPEPDSNGDAFLHCTTSGSGLGNVGFWQRMPCPRGLKFVYEKQRCTAVASIPVSTNNNTQPLPAPARPATPRAAVVRQVNPGESCRNGEQCGGNAFCNPDTFVCTCADGRTDWNGQCIRTISISRPGERCAANWQCTGNSECQQGICKCPAPLAQVGTECVRTSVMPQPVYAGDDCTLTQACEAGAVCSTVTGVCTCVEGFIQVGRVCQPLAPATHANLPQPQPEPGNGLAGPSTEMQPVPSFSFPPPARQNLAGIPCMSNNDCGNGAYCSALDGKSQTCQCLSTHVEVEQICHRIIYPGQSGCEFSQQCGAAFEGARCMDRVCYCPPGMSAQGQSCRPETANPGEACTNLTNCLGGSVCWRHFCRCPKNMKLSSQNRCVRTSALMKLEKLCTDSTSESCACPNNTYPLNGECQNVTDLLLLFKDTNTQFGDGANNLSALVFNFDLQATLAKLYRNLSAIENFQNFGLPGNPCLFGSVCTRNATCNAFGVCDCDTGYQILRNACSPVLPKLYEPCQPGQTCDGEAQCQNQVCSCPNGAVVLEDFCVVVGKDNPGARCRLAVHCQGNTLCSEGECRCVPGTERHNGRCVYLQYVPIGGACRTIEACYGGSACVDNTCQCTDNSSAVAGSCTQRPDGACDKGQICTLGSVCQNPGFCRCPSGWSLIDGICRAPSSKPGGECADGEQCLGQSVCTEGVCLCTGTAVIVNEECVENPGEANPNDDCRGKICVGNSQCDLTTFRCVCPANQAPVANVCREGYAQPGSSCLQGQVCTQNSICTSGVCTCPDGTVLLNLACVSQKQVNPGQSCLNGEQCLGGSFCREALCRCNPSETIANGRCQLTQNPSLPGQLCGALGGECVGETYCVNNSCVCLQGQVVVNYRCALSTQFSNPGESCAQNQQCVGQSSCLNNVCQCDAGMVIVNKACQPVNAAGPDQACNASTVCISSSSCVDGVCRCPSDHLAIAGVCMPQYVYPGESCLPAQSCTGQATCQSGFCICSSDQFVYQRQCIPRNANVNAPCVAAQSCVGGSTCLQGVCTCAATEIAIDNRCQAKQGNIGEPCTLGQQICMNNAQCISGVCACPPERLLSANTCILRVVSIGQPCIAAQTCVGGSSCVAGLCQCRIDQIAIQDQCMPQVVNVGDRCQVGQTCRGTAKCIQNICQCDPGFVSVAGECVVPSTNQSKPGERCDGGQVCIGSTCMNGLCQCFSGQVQIDGLCVNGVKPGQVCAANIPCIGGSQCANGTCICPTGTTLFSDQCLSNQATANPGASCKQNEQCSGGSYCERRTSLCLCPAGQVASNNLCRTTVIPNQSCLLGQLCSGASTCIEGMCRCGAQQVIQNDVCVDKGGTGPYVGPGTSCDGGKLCNGGSYCDRSNMCRCPPNQSVVGGICAQLSGPEESCSQGQLCIGGSQCNPVDKQCHCTSGATATNGVCLTFARPEESCANGETCLFESVCDALLRRCSCPLTYSLVAGQCKLNGLVGDTCNGTKRCLADAVCIAGVCQCGLGTVNVNGRCTTYLVKPGQPCATGQFCMAQSQCINSVCTCKENAVIINEQCVDQGSTRKPGEPCSNFPQVFCTGGSSCEEGYCACHPGQVVMQGFCASFVRYPGESCDASYQMCVGNSFCRNTVCQCLASLLPLGRTCIPGNMISRPNQPCLLGKICSGGSLCIAGMCVCPPGEVVVNGLCIVSGNLSPPGGKCSPTIRCAGNSICINGICTCPQDYAISNGLCVRMLVVSPAGASCAERQRCTGGSFCDGFLCKCPFDMFESDGFCFPSSSISLPGGTCFGNQVCVGGGVCQRSACVCPLETIVIDGECRRIATNVPLGGPCILNQQCMFGMLCKERQCDAPGQNELDALLLKGGGVLISPPGGTCAAGQQCTGGALCREGWCVCPDINMIVVNGQCTARQPQDLTAAPGMPCSASTRCLGGSLCKEGQCQCRAGFEILGELCIRQGSFSSQPGGSCSSGQSCTGNSFCDGRVCQCPATTQALNGVCMQFQAKPASSCANGEVCIGGSLCDGNICQCTPGSVLVNDTCLKRQVAKVVAGQVCDEYSQCQGGSFCINGRCMCPPGTTSVEDGSCQRRPLPINSPCDPNAECAGGSICFGGFCLCPYGTQEQGGVCVRVQEFPELTPAPEYPTFPSRAPQLPVRGSATLPPPRRPVETSPVIVEAPPHWLQPLTPRPPVVNSIDYSQPEAFCPNDAPPVRPEPCNAARPDCPVGSYCYATQEAENMTREVPAGLACSPMDVCTGGSICSAGFCMCPVGTTDNRMGFCVTTPAPAPVAPIVPFNPVTPVSIRNQQGGGLTAAPGDPCKTASECANGSYCRLGFCVCPLGTRSVSMRCVQSSATALPGSSCREGQVCVGRSTCVGGFCACPFGSSNYGGVCKDPTEQLPLYPGDPCASNDFCSGNSVCSMGECRCPVGTHTVAKACEADSKLVLPGNVCSDTQVCVGWSTCVGGFCRCEPGYMLSGTACLSQNDQKSNSEQNAPIRRKIAIASTNSTMVVTRLINAGQRCKHDYYACSGGSYCDAGFCRCLPNMHAENGVCVSKVHASTTAYPGESCRDNQICEHGSVCDIDKVCRCPFGHLLMDGMCQLPKKEVEGASICPLPDIPSLCRPPKCYCGRTGTEIPGNMTVSQIPQLVVVSFDDAVNGKSIDVYKRLFNGRFKNKNGCAIKGTFFVSHEWTNYDDAQWLSYQGHEIASNSITHESLMTQPESRWKAEMDGLRRAMNKFAKIDPTTIVGMRAPLLDTGGDNMFRMMQTSGFMYDNSMTANPGQDSPPYWPQTLDYEIPWECQNGRCPQGPHPGLWEVPLNQFYGYYLKEVNGYKRGSMLSAAMSTVENEKSTLELIRKNFNRGYLTNKAPFVLPLDGTFLNILEDASGITVLEKFLEEVLQKPDVWVVTMRQMLSWMENPTPLHELMAFPPFQCATQSNTPKPCSAGNKCMYKTPEMITGEHLFRTCGACPRRYPWVNNPEGN